MNPRRRLLCLGGTWGTTLLLAPAVPALACGPAVESQAELLDLLGKMRGFDSSAVDVEVTADVLETISSLVRESLQRSLNLVEVVERRVLDEFEKGEVRMVGGWVLSRTEAHLLACASTTDGIKDSMRLDAQEQAGGAIHGRIASILKWGPKRTCAGRGFNMQRDGHSAIWISLESDAPAGLTVLMGGQLVPTKQVGTLLTTRLEGELFDRLFSQPGTIEVQILDEFQSMLQSVGYFEVLDSGKRALTTEGKPSQWFREVSNWGPKQTIVGRAFNAQKDGASAVWINSPCAPPGTRVRLGNYWLEASLGPTTISAKLLDQGAIAESGLLDLELVHEPSGETVRVGRFAVVDP